MTASYIFFKSVKSGVSSEKCTSSNSWFTFQNGEYGPYNYGHQIIRNPFLQPWKFFSFLRLHEVVWAFLECNSLTCVWAGKREGDVKSCTMAQGKIKWEFYLHAEWEQMPFEWLKIKQGNINISILFFCFVLFWAFLSFHSLLHSGF